MTPYSGPFASRSQSVEASEANRDRQCQKAGSSSRASNSSGPPAVPAADRLRGLKVQLRDGLPQQVLPQPPVMRQRPFFPAHAAGERDVSALQPAFSPGGSTSGNSSA